MLTIVSMVMEDSRKAEIKDDIKARQMQIWQVIVEAAQTYMQVILAHFHFKFLCRYAWFAKKLNPAVKNDCHYMYHHFF
jgi:hypothetical protein